MLSFSATKLKLDSPEEGVKFLAFCSKSKKGYVSDKPELGKSPKCKSEPCTGSHTIKGFFSYPTKEYEIIAGSHTYWKKVIENFLYPDREKVLMYLFIGLECDYPIIEALGNSMKYYFS